MGRPKKPNYFAVDLFAGIGGIRLGFQRSFKKRIEINFVCEIDKNARITYKANFKSPADIHDDITTLTEENIEKMQKFDICMAGFPCQAFSMAGKRKGLDDNHDGKNRGVLFLDVIRICKIKKPMVIFCENVKGLVHHNKGETLLGIKKEFEKIGYKVEIEILDSRNYDVPQHRERLYMVAFRKDINIDGFVFPKSFGRTDKTLEDIVLKTKVDSKYFLSEQYLNTLYKHRKEQKAKGNGFGFKIREMEDTSGTLLCGGMGKERNLIIDFKTKDFSKRTHIRGPVNKEHVRRLTPREWARLQGFPDNFRLKAAESHLYDQLGNSVTVPAIEAIANNILVVIDKHLSSGGKRFIGDDDQSCDN